MAKKLCSHCKNTAFRRLKRKGFLQTKVLNKLGFFPWECIMCRRLIFFRDDGRKTEDYSPY